MTSGKKFTFSTGLFYLLLFILMVVLDRVAPGGPCVPSGGIALFLFLPFIAIVGLVISVIGRVLGRESFRGPTIINGVVFLLYFSILIYATRFR